MLKWLLSVGLVFVVGCGQLEELLNKTEDDKAESWDGLSFEMTTENGIPFTLRSKDEEIHRGTDRFLICAESGISQVASVRLWMPGHNHGTTPVQLKSSTYDCKVIRDVNFSMDGRWEVQVTLTDGDTGAFSMQVAE